MISTGTAYQVDDVLVGLARTLRAAGVEAAPDRVHVFAGALTRLDATRRSDVYWAGRLTLCSDADDLPRYDRVFDAYFGARPATLVRRPVLPKLRTQTLARGERDAPSPEQQADEGEQTAAAAAASRTEQLRQRDVAELSTRERSDLYALLAAFRLPGETRGSRRRPPSLRGRVDRARTARMVLPSGGELSELRRHRRSERPRRVVLLVDVSGSKGAARDRPLPLA